jgi:hypothetical protein
MTQIQKHISRSPLMELRSSIQGFIADYTKKYSEVFAALSRPVAPLGGNFLENGHAQQNNNAGSNRFSGEKRTVSKNTHSVIYTLNAQYHHIGCSSQSEAQTVMAMLMTDGNRIPVGIYDNKNDSFEWEMIGQYFHSQDSLIEQQERLNEVLTVARALWRRDASWQPGYLQRPSFFA